MSPARLLGLSASLLAPMSIDVGFRNYGSPNSWSGSYGARRPYDRQRYAGAANRKQCIRRRAKNKQARASRKRNRR